MELSESFLKGVAQIKAAGFSHFKVELEAQLDRSEYGCGTCDGSGTHYCGTCGGDAMFDEEIRIDNTDENGIGTVGYELSRIECPDCDATSQVTCPDCNGNPSTQDKDWCQNFLEDNISAETRSKLVYGRFYNDGSVDSEYTFTLPIDESWRAVEIIGVFNQLAEVIGNGMDTSGAGMHLAILRGSNYPHGLSSHPDGTINNFSAEMVKLLPALYFLASPDHASRGLEYRPPQVARDKYSAINIGNGFMEYRIFETCYQRPSALLENIEVIANTLKYYSERKVSINAPAGIRIGSGGKGVSRFFETPAMLELLNRGLPLLKPADKTIAQLKQERGFKIDTKKAKIRRAELEREFRATYETEKARLKERRENLVLTIMEHAASGEDYHCYGCKGYAGQGKPAVRKHLDAEGYKMATFSVWVVRHTAALSGRAYSLT